MTRPDGPPPVVAFDPLGAFWLAWLKGVETGVASLILWQGAMAAMPRQAVSVTLNMPFANGYTETIAPWTNWGGVLRKAGDPETEREIVETVASYGRQLGWLLDLTLDLAEKSGNADETVLDPVRELKARVEAIKQKNKNGRA